MAKPQSQYLCKQLRRKELNIKSSTLREKCPYSELFWSAFSRIRTEYGEVLRISPYSVGMRENAEQNSSEFGHFLRGNTLELSKQKTHC